MDTVYWLVTSTVKRTKSTKKVSNSKQQCIIVPLHINK